MTSHRPLLASTVAAASLLAGLAVAPADAATSAPTAYADAAPCEPVLEEPAPAAEVLAESGSVPVQPGNPAVSARLTRTVAQAAEEAAVETGDEAGSDAAEGLWLDTCGKAFYVEEAHHHGPAEAGGATIGLDTVLFPLEETFSLHSNPGSTKTIYLDFDGHTLTGTAWNTSPYDAPSVQLPGYSFEGSASTFSDAERTAIQNIWAVVAEDYAPFDVDVTTELPAASAIERSGPSDEVYGTRAVITGDTIGQASCGCGGFAYIGVFNDHTDHSRYQPALAFTRGVGTSAKTVAEVVSHEVGHTLGLVHQGTGSQGYYNGHVPWAPIMGAGYYQPVTQWAQGEYRGANSQQDELVTMATYGLVPRPDDYGDTAASAHDITDAAAVGETVSGVISTTSDVDAFSFTLASPATVGIEVAVDPTAPNLDVDLRLLGADGTTVASANPPVVATDAVVVSGMHAALTELSLNAGDYTVTVDGAGFGAPATTGYSDYGSLGTYELTVDTAYTGAPRVSTTAIPAATVGVAYAATLEATSAAGGAVTWTLGSGALPKGIKLTPAGVLTGKTSSKGAHSFTLRATDAVGKTTAVAYTLDVATAVKVSGLTSTVANTGTAYTARPKIAGGTAPYTVAASSKPAWATVAGDGTITGTPTEAANAVFAVTVTDARGRTGAGTLKLYVGGPLRIETAAPGVGGTVLAARSDSFPLVAVGGNRRYKWQPDASTLPAGMTLSSTGRVTAKNLAPGTYTLTAVVADGLGATASRSWTITAVPALTMAKAKAAATVGEALSYDVPITGGVAPYAVTPGTLPAGWTFDGTTLSGTPQTARSVSVRLTILDAVGRKLAKSVSVVPRAALTVTTTTLPTGTVGRSLRVALRATGGYGKKTWSLETGTLPPGLTLSPTGTLSGVPTAAGTTEVRFTVVDVDGRVASSPTLTLAVT